MWKHRLNMCSGLSGPLGSPSQVAPMERHVQRVKGSLSRLISGELG